MSQSWTLPRLMVREGLIRRIVVALEALPVEKGWRLTLEEAKPLRSGAQNRLLWSLYRQIIQKGGEDMRGWEADDLHTFFLGNFHGWEKVKMFEQSRLRPMGRSHNLNKQAFSDYVDSIVRFMAERSVVLDLPEDGWR